MRFILQFLGWALLWFSGQSLALNVVTRVHCEPLWQQAECTVHSQQALQYHSFSLQNPDRLVIDIENAAGIPRPIFHLMKNSVVKRIRYVYLGHDQKLRVVLDLTPGSDRRVRLHFSSQAIFSAHPIIHRLSHLQHEKVKFYSAYQEGQEKRAQKKVLPLPNAGRKVVIVIDPGHGGKDPGAHGPRGIKEKNIVLTIAQRLQHEINREPGFVAFLTRKDDRYLTLRERLKVARNYQADMFVAIHADAFPSHHAMGASVYALSLRGATSEAARWIADKENESELAGGLGLEGKSNLLKSVLLDLSQSATIRSSLQMGRRIINFLGQIGQLHHREVEQAAFVVLKSPDIPSLLVETGFISNPFEERQLLSWGYQGQLARSIKAGICHYFEGEPPRNTWLAEQKFRTPGLISLDR